MRHGCGNRWKTWWYRGLRLSVYDRAVYSHLLRHSRLEGRTQSCFSIPWLARGACLTLRAARRSVHSLVGKGALRLAERGQVDHVVKVLLPEEIRSLGAAKIGACATANASSATDFEKVDFLGTRALRLAIHAREGGRCFYCLGRLNPRTRCIDHVVARVRGGGNGYRNLVSACAECNLQKGEQRAEAYLRWLCREGRLSAAEFRRRNRALADLAAGKMRPSLENRKWKLEKRKNS
jgi:hypothetical protein